MKKLIKRIIRTGLTLLYRIMSYVLPVKSNVIVFEAYTGRNYSGNVRAIYENMVKKGLDNKYKLVWSMQNPEVIIPGNVTIVKRTRLKYLYYMAVAKVWISDSRMPLWLRKRKKCKFIQTWHGTPLKQLALDMKQVNMAESGGLDKFRASYKKNSVMWDYLISQNSFSTAIFRSCFAYDKDILEIGYPRNDVLISSNKEADIIELKKKYDLPLDKRIILYAPTWRDDQYYGKDSYKFNTPMEFDKMRDCLGEKYCLIVKLHHLISDSVDWKAYEGFIYDCNGCQDIAELFLISDMLITDYSSVMFDYSILKRPIIFFTYDLEHYKNNLHDFYFDFLGTAPGPVVETTKDLIEAIDCYDADSWKELYDAFNRTYNHADCGNASDMVVELIESFNR